MRIGEGRGTRLPELALVASCSPGVQGTAVGVGLEGGAFVPARLHSGADTAVRPARPVGESEDGVPSAPATGAETETRRPATAGEVEATLDLRPDPAPLVLGVGDVTLRVGGCSQAITRPLPGGEGREATAVPRLHAQGAGPS